ncbi:MAG: MerR family transcriptional regulator [Deltaproteobacteria bacterium]|nr:MerR family transcriptional regulator [Deltaproteobacteria bacterium]
METFAEVSTLNFSRQRVEEDIPRKAFYSIGEVSRITGVNTHVLRYWETQGKLLKPSRRGSRHRLYRPADIQLILEIKRLREEEKLSLAAMRRQMNHKPEQHRLQPRLFSPAPLDHQVLSLLKTIRDELLALKELLE